MGLFSLRFLEESGLSIRVFKSHPAQDRMTACFAALVDLHGLTVVASDERLRPIAEVLQGLLHDVPEPVAQIMLLTLLREALLEVSS